MQAIGLLHRISEELQDNACNCWGAWVDAVFHNLRPTRFPRELEDAKEAESKKSDIVG